jgi:hypothetical protein
MSVVPFWGLPVDNEHLRLKHFNDLLPDALLIQDSQIHKKAIYGLLFEALLDCQYKELEKH